MASKLLTFTITNEETGHTAEVVVTKLDVILVERELGYPPAERAKQGFIEPALKLAYQAANRAKALPEGTTFEDFAEAWDTATGEDDEESNPGN